MRALRPSAKMSGLARCPKCYRWQRVKGLDYGDHKREVREYVEGTPASVTVERCPGSGRRVPAVEVERAKAVRDLLEDVRPGDTLYTVLKHCAHSGMYRVVDVYIYKVDKRRVRGAVPIRLSWSIARACGMRYDKRHEGIGVGGCGMDVGFEVVYNLAAVLFPSGFRCTGECCPSNEHSNGCRDYSGKLWHKGGEGYALKHRWQ